MFTGFASENTPAIQVWEFARASASATARRTISLSDDCAPIQYFKTGASSFHTIDIYLPSSPIEGKRIIIVNSKHGASNQSINLYSSDTNAGGTSNLLYLIGAGKTLELCYSKEFISFGTNVGVFSSGWISLNQSPATAANAHSVAMGYSVQATALRSTVIGGNGNTASGNDSIIAGGIGNTASGSFASIFCGESNTASNTNSIILGGFQNTASGIYAAVIGANSSTASGLAATIIGGDTNSCPGSIAVILGGGNNTANSDYTAVIGGRRGNTRSIQGYTVFPASVQPIASATGVSQTALLLLGRETTDATATVLRSNTSPISTANQITLPNNSAYVFQGTCIANVTGGSTTSGWKFEGVIKRGANAASTTLVAAVTPTVIAQDALASTWVLAITADTTNGCIKVEVTGAAATTIRWVSKIETTEVTF